MSTPRKHFSFVEIYTYALTLMRDSDLIKLKSQDSFLFMQKMYNYMIVAIAEYTIPAAIYPILSDRTDPEYLSEEFVGDGINNEFTLDPLLVPSSNSEFRCSINGVTINATCVDGVLITEDIPGIGEIVFYELYTIGMFSSGLSDRQTAILASLTTYIWALQVSNNEEDITRLLLDSDFKMDSESRVTVAKTTWVNSYREKAYSLMNGNDWGFKFLNNSNDNTPMIY